MESQYNYIESSRSGAVMAAPIRRNNIAKIVVKEGFLSVSSAAKLFNVSAMTIRRDLELLDKRGIIQRSFGGAVKFDNNIITNLTKNIDPIFSRRTSEHKNEKRCIANAALGLVLMHESIGLDVGTTVCELAKLLVQFRGLNIITNSLRSVIALAESESAECNVHLLGGHARIDEGAICGPVTINQLRKYSLNKVFLGAAGLTAEGVFDFSVEDSEVKKAFIEVSDQVILLCDSSKFGKRSLYQFASLDSITKIVTDAPPPEDISDALKLCGVDILISPCELIDST